MFQYHKNFILPVLSTVAKPVELLLLKFQMQFEKKNAGRHISFKFLCSSQSVSIHHAVAFSFYGSNPLTSQRPFGPILFWPDILFSCEKVPGCQRVNIVSCSQALVSCVSAHQNWFHIIRRSISVHRYCVVRC